MDIMRDAFAGQSVLVTGHTGFKGGWLSLWLHALGARVHGYALDPPTTPSLYHETRLAEILASERIADIRDYGSLVDAVRAARPEVVFHLAAQAIVLRSYQIPRETWESNVIGTGNLLEAIRTVGGVKACVVITSDKCYENVGAAPLKETDRLGGPDPYSASKAAAELAVAAWRHSFFHPQKVAEHGVSVATARAGNVIGGGDWAEYRIIPDCVRALERSEPIVIRNPSAVRPWQHVLAPISGYLQLAARQLAEPARFADAFNFGPRPANTLTVAEVADLAVRHWGSGRWHASPESVSPTAKPYEAPFLQLDISKATAMLDWRPVFSASEAVAQTIEWYRRRHQQAGDFDARATCLVQIGAYQARQAGN